MELGKGCPQGQLFLYLSDMFLWSPLPCRWTGLGLSHIETRMDWDDELDALGLLCPLPVLKARKRLNAMAGGTVLRVLATDPAAIIDIPHFCAEAGHELIDSGPFGNAQYYLIKARAV